MSTYKLKAYYCLQSRVKDLYEEQISLLHRLGECKIVADLETEQGQHDFFSLITEGHYSLKYVFDNMHNQVMRFAPANLLDLSVLTDSVCCPGDIEEIVRTHNVELTIYPPEGRCKIYGMKRLQYDLTYAALR